MLKQPNEGESSTLEKTLAIYALAAPPLSLARCPLHRKEANWLLEPFEGNPTTVRRPMPIKVASV